MRRKDDCVTDFSSASSRANGPEMGHEVVPASNLPRGSSLRASLIVPNWKSVVDALISAHEALVGDSGDAEHDALSALVRALDSCVSIEWGSYSREWLITDFCRWHRLGENDYPSYDEIDMYLTQGRPRDSSPLFVRDVLYAWSDERTR
jgi:hypothetical protein